MSRTRRDSALSIVMWMFALGACADANAPVADSESVVDYRDSAGVEIVSYAALDVRTLEQWEIGAEPITRVGDDRLGASHQFGLISGVARMPDGRVIVAVDQSALLAFDSAGNFLSRLARKGRGPEEFTRLTALHRLRGDTLLAYQHFPESVTLFAPDGSFLGTSLLVRPSVQQEFSEFAAFEFRSAFPDGSLLVQRHGGERLIDVGEVHSDSVRPLRVSLSGAVLADFGTRWHEDQTRVRTVSSSDGAPIPPSMASMPYSIRSATWGVVGERLFYSTRDRFEVELWSAHGRLERIVRVTTEPNLPVRKEPYGFMVKGVRYTTERPTRPFEPPVGDIRGDRRGNLWVSVHSHALSDSTVHYVVFDTSGVARAAVRWRMPRSENSEWRIVGNWQHIDDHAFTTVAMDADDRFHVLVFPLLKSVHR